MRICNELKIKVGCFDNCISNLVNEIIEKGFDEVHSKAVDDILIGINNKFGSSIYVTYKCCYLSFIQSYQQNKQRVDYKPVNPFKWYVNVNAAVKK